MIHAKLSPSSSHRWLACPGSVLPGPVIDGPGSVYALEGTSAHALLEVCLRTGDDPNIYIGKVLERGHMEISADMCDGVGYALDYIAAYLADHPRAKLLIEEKVHYGASIMVDDEQYEDEEAANALAFGYADVILDDYPNEVVGIDYKHGIGNPVSVKENTQIRLYLLAMRQRRGGYRRYRAVVVQPRLPRRKPVQEAPAITDKELMKWVNDKVIPIVPEALSGTGSRNAGSWCRYCHADGNCQAQYALVMAAATKEFKDAK